MKNKIKFIGIIAFIAVIGLFVGCGKETGGSLEIVNKTGGEIGAFAAGGTQVEVNEKLNKIMESSDEDEISKYTIVNDAKKTLATISEDGDIWYFWQSMDGKKGMEEIARKTVTKGETITIEAK